MHSPAMVCDGSCQRELARLGGRVGGQGESHAPGFACQDAELEALEWFPRLQGAEGCQDRPVLRIVSS